MENNFDTIVAIATPLSFGAVGIVRISGLDALKIAQSIFTRTIQPKKINYGHIKNTNGEIIDEVILLPFLEPHSYTGEDVVEIQTHGSPVIINSVLELILEKGARLASRGEFTKRAFLNHRIDLSQAEAVLDIIQSKSQTAAKNALSNLGGYLKNKTDEIKKDLTELYSRVIASIDFPEDVAEIDINYIVSKCNDNILAIDEILKNSKSHDFIRDGISVCLTGRPNVGKSSLFNALLSYTRAIVTPIEGTTRDTIKETLNLDGYLINIVDTAGIRDKNKADLVEKIGIDNSIESINLSDIVLFLFENSLDEIEEQLLEIAKDKKSLFIKTKADINNNADFWGKDVIEISSKTGFGIDKLKNKLKEIICDFIPQDTNYTTNKRQQTCLLRAKEALLNVIQSSEFDNPEDLFAIDLKGAILALDEISGEVLTDNILDNIFDNFCIGK